LIKLRSAHITLKQNSYGDNEMDDNDNEVTYLFRKTDSYSYLDENDRCVWLRIDGSSVADHDFLIMINMYNEPVSFTIPKNSETQVWKRVVDTAAWAEYHNNCWNIEQADSIEGNYTVEDWSIVILEEISK
jgi:glycogen operon protein